MGIEDYSEIGDLTGPWSDAPTSEVSATGGVGTLAFAVLALWLVVADPAAPRAQPLQPDGYPQRIVSLIPAVTEMLFAMGAGPRVVAVSSFDEYPPEVRTLQRVGALLDPDVERILFLKPDLVIVYATQTDLIQQLARAHVPTFQYQHAGLADVNVTIRTLGARVGQERDAADVAARIDAGFTAIRRRVASRTRVRTLVVFGREAFALRGIYASGGFGFLHDMVVVAGGDNVFADVARESVQATSETILARRPEAIVELRAGAVAGESRAKEIAVWNALPGLPAVKAGRVFLITDPRTVVPGPRVAEGAELIARAIHPDAFR